MQQILNEVDRTWLTVEADPGLRDQFELRMLEENRIEGLLKLSVCDNNGKLILSYDITGVESLASAASLRKLTAADLRNIILTLRHVISSMAPYLLEPSGLVLNADSVFLSPHSGAPVFLYSPGKENTFPADLSEFLQMLLALTDHDDYNSVVLAYRLYKESLDHPSALDRLEQILISQADPADSALYAENPEENIPLSEILSDLPEAPQVTAVRETPAEVRPADREKSGLFHRLFRKQDAEPEAVSAEEARWTAAMTERT